MQSAARQSAASWINIIFAVAVIFLLTAHVPAQCEPEQEMKLTANDADSFDRFGIEVSISGERALVGAYLDEASGPSSGSAYVFVNENNTWVQEDKLVPTDGASGDWFGVSVSIDGDRALVGAQNHDDGANDAGAAYIFERQPNQQWIQMTKLTASQPSPSDWVGHAVALDGDRAIVSAQLDDENGNNAGAAYIFERDTNGVWFEAAKLIASGGAAGDEFGTSVAIHGDVAVVGGRFDNDPQAGANAGSAYVFRRNDKGAWQEETKLLPGDLDAGDEFGFAVAVEVDLVLVGARLDDDNGDNAGAVYVFHQKAGEAWIEQTKLLASDGAGDDRFGESVSINAGRAVVGSRLHDAAGNDAGAAYVFERTVSDGEAVWNETAKLIGKDTAGGDFFGISVAVDAGRAIAGANLDSDAGNQSGSAYVFNLAPGGAIPGDFDCSGDVGVADLLQMLAAWGPCPACPEDLNHGGSVNVSDLLILLANWG